MMRRNRSHLPKIETLLTAGAIALILFAVGSGQCEAYADIPSLQASAEKGVVKDEIELAGAYFVGRGVPQDLKAAAYWYEKAANLGDPSAEHEIGFLYQTGMGVPKDPVRAVHWYQRAAAAGSIASQVNLAVAYLSGSGVKADPAFGLQLLHEAAAHESGLAACYLGDVYFEGRLAPKDDSLAEQWWKKGVAHHEPMAEFRMGMLLSDPNSPKKDLKRAAEMFRRSSDSGYVPGMHEYGVLLVQHPELSKGSEEAEAVLKQSAGAGMWRSSVVLGILARDGRGRPRDLEEAYYQFDVARLEGGQAAAQLLANDFRKLSGKLDAAQIAKVHLRAADWATNHKVNLQFVFKGGVSFAHYPAFGLEFPDPENHAGHLIPTSTEDPGPRP